MRQNRNQHPTRDDEHARGDQAPRDAGELKESGVLPTSMVLWIRGLRHLEPWLPGEDPPWTVVNHYLTYGDDAVGIEEHARQSRAFAYVLQAMQNQEDDACEDEIDPPSSGPPTLPLGD